MRVWERLSPSEQERLTTEQERLETRSIQLGIARYRTERSDRDPSLGWPEQRAIGAAIRTLSPAIHDVQKAVAAGKPMRGATHWGPHIMALHSDSLAFIALIEMVNHADMGDMSSVVTVAGAIGGRVKIEREYLILRKEAPDVYKFYRTHARNWTRRVHRKAKTKAGCVDMPWNRKTRTWVGVTLLGLVLDHTNLFVLDRFVSNGKTTTQLKMRPKMRDAVEEAHRTSELLRPFHLPMVVPPLKWEDQFTGGYLHHRVRLVKPNLAGADEDDERLYTDPKLVIEAVNHLQQTEWRINTRILSVMQSLWDAGAGWAFRDKRGQELTAEPLPIPPPTFSWSSASDEEKRAWKEQAHEIHGQNALLASKRKSTIHKLWIANLLKDKEVIYFPHQLDWRGRAYPLPGHLHPQADDVGRALLQFAEGRPPSKRGLFWIKVHLANCYGVKGSHDQRAAWVDDHLSDARASAQNPVDHRWWSGGDDCWQVLATCMELAHVEAGGTSSIPVYRDGSCNGLQHFSAMGRDEEGGALVNLIPDSQPRSVYDVVKDRINDCIRRDSCETDDQPSESVQTPSTPTSLPECGGSSASSTSTATSWSGSLSDSGAKRTESSEPSKTQSTPRRSVLARRWMGRITREVAKRPTMTIVYGLTKGGMQRQLIRDGHCKGMDGRIIDNANYLRDVVWDVLDGALPKAMAIMRWLRYVAEEASEAGVALQWVTPVGLLVIQEYLEQREINLYTALQKITLRAPSKDAGIDRVRQVRGVPPNFVHSMDAAHMMLTALGCRDSRIAFTAVHDSFGCHANDADAVNVILREKFVAMYERPILADLHRQWSMWIGKQLDPPPALGGLDLLDVLRSHYFFS